MAPSQSSKILQNALCFLPRAENDEKVAGKHYHGKPNFELPSMWNFGRRGRWSSSGRRHQEQVLSKIQNLGAGENGGEHHQQEGQDTLRRSSSSLLDQIHSVSKRFANSINTLHSSTRREDPHNITTIATEDGKGDGDGDVGNTFQTVAVPSGNKLQSLSELIKLGLITERSSDGENGGEQHQQEGQDALRRSSSSLLDQIHSVSKRFANSINNLHSSTRREDPHNITTIATEDGKGDGDGDVGDTFQTVAVPSGNKLQSPSELIKLGLMTERSSDGENGGEQHQQEGQDALRRSSSSLLDQIHSVSKRFANSINNLHSSTRREDPHNITTIATEDGKGDGDGDVGDAFQTVAVPSGNKLQSLSKLIKLGLITERSSDGNGDGRGDIGSPVHPIAVGKNRLPAASALRKLITRRSDEKQQQHFDHVRSSLMSSVSPKSSYRFNKADEKNLALMLAPVPDPDDDDDDDHQHHHFPSDLQIKPQRQQKWQKENRSLGFLAKPSASEEGSNVLRESNSTCKSPQISGPESTVVQSKRASLHETILENNLGWNIKSNNRAPRVDEEKENANKHVSQVSHSSPFHLYLHTDLHPTKTTKEVRKPREDDEIDGGGLSFDFWTGTSIKPDDEGRLPWNHDPMQETPDLQPKKFGLAIHKSTRLTTTKEDEEAQQNGEGGGTEDEGMPPWNHDPMQATPDLQPEKFGLGIHNSSAPITTTKEDEEAQQNGEGGGTEDEGMPPWNLDPMQATRDLQPKKLGLAIHNSSTPITTTKVDEEARQNGEGEGEYEGGPPFHFDMTSPNLVSGAGEREGENPSTRGSWSPGSRHAMSNLGDGFHTPRSSLDASEMGARLSGDDVTPAAEYTPPVSEQVGLPAPDDAAVSSIVRSSGRKFRSSTDGDNELTAFDGASHHQDLSETLLGKLTTTRHHQIRYLQDELEQTRAHVAELDLNCVAQKNLKVAFKVQAVRIGAALKRLRDFARENGLDPRGVDPSFVTPSAQPKDIVRQASDTEYKTEEINASQKLDLLKAEAKQFGWLCDPKEVVLRDYIGSGSSAEIFKAVWHNVDVAVKCVRPNLFGGNTEEAIAGFCQEVEIQSRQRHPYILRMFAACLSPPDRAWIISEYLPSGTLTEWLHGTKSRDKKRIVPLPPLSERLRISVEISIAMEYLHKCSPKILHRDLKPSNILLDENKHVRIADFNCSRYVTDKDAILTGETGTYVYMAPEVMAHECYDQMCDVYSFAVLLCELVTGNPPYIDTNYSPVEIACKVAQGTLRPTLPENQPVALMQLIQSAWKQDPRKRPSFSEITATLNIIAEDFKYAEEPSTNALERNLND